MSNNLKPYFGGHVGGHLAGFPLRVVPHLSYRVWHGPRSSSFTDHTLVARFEMNGEMYALVLVDDFTGHVEVYPYVQESVISCGADCSMCKKGVYWGAAEMHPETKRWVEEVKSTPDYQRHWMR